jgi:hypothetical protein
MHMRARKPLEILSLGFILFLSASTVAAGDESEKPMSEQERSQAQRTAQRFVRRMQQTRDVNALIPELFLPNFVSHFVSGESDYPEHCARFSQSERRRWFVAHYNISYLIALDVLQSSDRNPSDPGYEASIFKSFLPDKLAERLQTIAPHELDVQCKDYPSLRPILVRAERALADARAYLLRKRIEQTPEFQKRLDDKITNFGIDYRVRAYLGGGNVKDCPMLIGFPPRQKFYRVEIPLFIGVILVKHAKQMKIVTLTYVDGD